MCIEMCGIKSIHAHQCYKSKNDGLKRLLKEVSDRNGAWAYKNGNSHVLFDNAGKSIYDPQKESISGFPHFICFFAIKSIVYPYY